MSELASGPERPGRRSRHERNEPPRGGPVSPEDPSGFAGLMQEMQQAEVAPHRSEMRRVPAATRQVSSGWWAFDEVLRIA